MFSLKNIHVHWIQEKVIFAVSPARLMKRWWWKMKRVLLRRTPEAIVRGEVSSEGEKSIWQTYSVLKRWAGARDALCKLITSLPDTIGFSVKSGLDDGDGMAVASMQCGVLWPVVVQRLQLSNPLLWF